MKKRCGVCGIELRNDAYAYMSADGELTISSLEIYGIPYILCPECTLELDNFLDKLAKEKKKENVKKHCKIININDYKNK